MLLIVAMLLPVIPVSPVYADTTTDWRLLGGAAFTSPSTNFTSLCVDRGTAYAAGTTQYSGHNKTAIFQSDKSGSWQQVGPYLQEEAQYGSLYADKRSLYFAYVTLSDEAKVVKHDMDDPHGDWEEVVMVGDVDGEISLYAQDEITYVAYTLGGNLSVARYNEMTKSHYVIDDLSTSDLSGFVSLKGDDHGNIYMSYVDGGNAVVKKSSNGGDNWELVGGIASVGGKASNLSLFVYDDMPFVAFTDVKKGGVCVVKTFRGGNWENVGNTDRVSDYPATGNSLYIDESGTPYIAFKAGDSHNAMVYKLDNSSWEPVGTGGYASTGTTSHLSLAVDRGISYLAYRDDGRNNAGVVMWYEPPSSIGSEWETVGNGPLSSTNSNFTSLCMDDGIPYVTYSDKINAQDSDRIVAEKFVQNQWKPVGLSRFSSGEFVKEGKVYVDKGTPYLSYITKSGNVVVLKLDSGEVTDWTTVGRTLPIDVAAELSLYVHNGDSYVAYSVINDGYSPVVKRFPQGSAAPDPVGDLGKTTLNYMSIKGDTAGNLYLVFRSNNRLEVMKKPYSSNTWSQLGDFVSSGEAFGPSLYLYDNGTSEAIPYVAYADVQAGFQPIVKKLEEGEWRQVGGGYVSGDSASETSLCVDEDGTPYVAYVMGDGGPSKVFKLDNYSWVPVGAKGYASEGGTCKISLAVSQGVPYLSYIDYTSGGKAIVRRYVSYAVQPTISSEPSDQTVAPGQTASFSVTAAGTAPFTYQWYKGPKDQRTKIDGAKSSVLTITNAQELDEGFYTCKVENPVGEVFSREAVLIVNEPKNLVSLAIPGDRHVFLLWDRVSGASSYQLYQDTALIGTTPDDEYDVTGLANGTTYSFEVKALDANGVVIASSSPISAAPYAPTGDKTPPTILSQPSDQTVVRGQIATFTVTVSGTEPFSYQWFKDGAMLVGENSSTLRILNAQKSAEGVYVCNLCNNFGADVTAGARLTVNEPGTLAFTATPGDRNINLTWNDVPEAFCYRIFQDGTPVGTATNNTFDVTGLINGTAYRFEVKAFDGNDVLIAASGVVSAAPSEPSSTSTGHGSSSSSPKASNSGADILVNGKAENAATASTTTQDGKTVTTVALDPEKLKQKLDSEGNRSVISIPVNAASDVVIGQLNGEMVKNMESKQAVIEVKTGAAAYTLPAQQINIKAISKQLGQNVALGDIKVQIEIAKSTANTVQVVENSAQKGNFTLVVSPVDFTVKCTYGNKTVEVSQFNNYVERTVAIPDGVDPNKITTGVVVDPDGTVRHVPTRITVIGGRYYAVINSLTNSTYSVVWNPLEFKDVANHWAKKAVNDMGSRMVISGIGNGLFEPNRDITRAEFAAIVVRALGLKPGTGKTSFSDVKQSEWYSGAIETASAYGLITGYENDTFRPMEKITREQAMAIIDRAMEITGLKQDIGSSDTNAILASFGDSDKTSSWAKESTAACVKVGIVSGKNGNLLVPKANITRAEVATIVSRLLKESDLIN